MFILLMEIIKSASEVYVPNKQHSSPSISSLAGLSISAEVGFEICSSSPCENASIASIFSVEDRNVCNKVFTFRV